MWQNWIQGSSSRLYLALQDEGGSVELGDRSHRNRPQTVVVYFTVHEGFHFWEWLCKYTSDLERRPTKYEATVYCNIRTQFFIIRLPNIMKNYLPIRKAHTSLISYITNSMEYRLSYKLTVPPLVKKFPHFMETEGSHETATFPYPQSD